MKTTTKFLSFMLLAFLAFTSCREAEFEAEGIAPDRTLQANSKATNLMIRTASKDGSGDNIIDQSSCISVALPVTVIVNGTTLEVTNENECALIETLLEENDEEENDEDNLEIVFPITIVFADFTEAMVTTQEELDGYVATCGGEDVEDEDIECIDFVYPIRVSSFNTETEIIDARTLTNDKALYQFVSELESADVVNIEFPINLELADGMLVEAGDLETLENQIENFKDSCNEDDNNDFDDDDCDDCNPTKLEEAFLICNSWRIAALKLNDENKKPMYRTYRFDFRTDGALEVTEGNNTIMGNWSAEGVANDITVEITLPELENLNGSWKLNEIVVKNDRTKVRLRKNRQNKLTFSETCTPRDTDRAD